MMRGPSNFVALKSMQKWQRNYQLNIFIFTDAPIYMMPFWASFFKYGFILLKNHKKMIDNKS